MLGERLVAELVEVGRQFHRRGWVPASGGNFSARAGSERILITRSGVHKGELRDTDFLAVDLEGRAYGDGKPSYETPLHLCVYRERPRTGCVLHTHSVANTVLSRRVASLRLAGYELQKVLPAVDDPARAVQVPVFANDQDVSRLSERLATYLRATPEAAAFLLAGHGLYAWGEDVTQARYRIEALEFMLECELWAERLK